MPLRIPMDLERVEVAEVAPEGFTGEWHQDYVRAEFICQSCGFQDIYFYDLSNDRQVLRPYCPMKKCMERACQ